MLFCSCSSTKKYKEQNTIVQSELKQNDSTKTTTINRVINDTLITPVVQSNTGNKVLDSLVNAKVDEILQKLNTAKTSGDNAYRLMYDKLKKQLEFYSKISQTKNESLQVKKQKDKVIIQIKKMPVEIVKTANKIREVFNGIGHFEFAFSRV